MTAVYHDVDGQEISYYSQRPDGSLVEHRSFISDSQQDSELNANDGDGIYLNSTTEFFPVEDQDEQVYLEEYADGKICFFFFFSHSRPPSPSP